MSLRHLVRFNSTSGLSANEQAMRQKHAARVAKAQQRSAERAASTIAADNNRPGIRRAEAQARLRNRPAMNGTQRFLRRAKADIRATVKGVGIKSGWNRAARQGKGFLGRVGGAARGLGVPFMKGGTVTGKTLVGGAAVGAVGAGLYGANKLLNRKRKANYSLHLLSADFAKSNKPIVPRTVSNTVNGAIGGGGTGALLGLLAKPNSGKFQRRAAAIGVALGAARGLQKSIKFKKPRRRLK